MSPLTTLDAVRALGGTLYVRWSADPEMDRHLSGSLNRVSGLRECGLSVCALDLGAPDHVLASRLQEYEFLRLERADSRGWLLRGEVVGWGADGEPCLKPETIEVIGVLGLELERRQLHPTILYIEHMLEVSLALVSSLCSRGKRDAAAIYAADVAAAQMARERIDAAGADADWHACRLLGRNCQRRWTTAERVEITSRANLILEKH